jgi:hypothetical protein
LLWLLFEHLNKVVAALSFMCQANVPAGINVPLAGSSADADIQAGD